MPIDSIRGVSAPSAYSASKLSRRYSKKWPAVLNPCGVAKRMSLVSSV
jgi:hypothetical protein